MTTYPSTTAAAFVSDFSPPLIKRTMWGSIMIGAVCAIGIQFVFTVLGMAVGATAADPTPTETGVRTVTALAGVWWLITGTIALFAGGLVLGRVVSLPRGATIKICGGAMWAVVAVFGFAVLWSGVGMASAATSPLAIMSGSDTRSDRTLFGAGREAASADALRVDAVQAEAVRRAARTAAWWSVIGLLAGLGASVAGACVGSGMANMDARRHDRDNTAPAL
ncbi:MAG TPA: hypothetical protein VF777_13440 [Phycisphaerales bacterium]